MDIEISAKKFFDFETKNKLFLKKINNLSYWDYIRYPTFIEILNHFKGKNKSYIYNQSQNSKFSNTLNNLLSLFYHSLKFLIKILKIILAKNKYDLIFYSAGGRKKTENIFINPYCFYHLKKLSKSYKILVIETHIFKDKSFQKIDCDYICIPWRMIRLLSFFKPVSRKARREINSLTLKLEDSFNFKVDVKLFIKNNFYTQSIINKIINKIIKSTNPKLMGFVNDGNSKFFLKAAKDNKITIFELQHGDVSKHDIVSSYPKNIIGEYWIPDEIFIFGNYWKNRYNLDSNKITIGNPVFDINYDKFYKDKKNNRNSILCISVNSTDFAKFIFEASKIDQSINYYFKLRDSEYDNWRKNYPFLLNTKNFTIIDNNERHLYELIGESSYIATTFSTVIYEALSLKRNVIIIKDKDFAYVKNLVSISLVELSESINEFVKKVKTNQQQQAIRKSFFYKPNSLENFNVAINRIIN